MFRFQLINSGEITSDIILGQHRLIPTQEKCQEEHICDLEFGTNCNASKLFAEFYESKQ